MMKISYLYHGLILALCIYAIGCCGFHFFPVWGVSDHYESINNTLLSLALSYVAGLVIYYLTSVMPRKQREKEIFEQWAPHLSELYNEMSERIEEVRAYVGISQEAMANLTVEDCKPLERYTNQPSVVWLSKTIIMDDYNKPLRLNDMFSIKKVLNGHHDVVHSIIDTMLMNPVAVYAEKKILDILSQIKSSVFLLDCNRVMDSSKLQNPPISINHSDFPKAYRKYVKLRDRLGALPISINTYDIRLMTKEEVMEYQKKVEELLANQGLTQERIQAFGQQMAKASFKHNSFE